MYSLREKILNFELTRKVLLIVTLFFIILQKFFVDSFGLPVFISYIGDGLVAIILLILILRIKSNDRMLPKPISFILLGFLFIGALSTLLSSNSIMIKIWGIKDFFKCYIFFIACIKWLDSNDVNKLFSSFFVVQILNLIAGLYQYFVLGYYMDMLGGIFGHGNGAILNVFQAVICGYYLLRYLNQRKDLLKLIYVLISSIIVAAMAEEKAFFIYILFVAALCVIISKPNFKTILVTGLVIGTFFIGIDVLSKTNEAWNLDVLFNLDSMVEYGEKSYGVSRINPFKDINDVLFHDVYNRLFGMGLGAAYVSNTAILQTPLFLNYEYLQYYNFTHASIYIEIGMIGFILYLSFFVYLLIYYLKKMIKYKNDVLIKTSIVAVVIAILSIWFARSLICNEYAFLYFAITIGFSSTLANDRGETYEK